jgi:uncharacterized protein YecE (DUF72 family)
VSLSRLSGPNGPPSLYIGTSGWHYDHWRGPFYPETLPKREWLAFYSERFRCVEINNTFYSFPSEATVAAWAERTPGDFVFALKASQYITHRKKLKDSAEAVARFTERAERFGSKLGPVLFQLPPRWRCNPQRLDAFLRALPPGFRYVMEFRDPSWHTREVTDLLAEHNVGFCVFEIEGFRSPRWSTSDLAYVRLHGPRLAYTGSYDRQALEGWARQVRSWRASDHDVFIFFDNDDQGFAVDNALSLLELTRDGS